MEHIATHPHVLQASTAEEEPATATSWLWLAIPVDASARGEGFDYRSAFANADAAPVRGQAGRA